VITSSTCINGDSLTQWVPRVCLTHEFWVFAFVPAKLNDFTVKGNLQKLVIAWSRLGD
jgi:hypothetical protein